MASLNFVRFVVISVVINLTLIGCEKNANKLERQTNEKGAPTLQTEEPRACECGTGGDDPVCMPGNLTNGDECGTVPCKGEPCILAEVPTDPTNDPSDIGKIVENLWLDRFHTRSDLLTAKNSEEEEGIPIPDSVKYIVSNSTGQATFTVFNHQGDKIADWLVTNDKHKTAFKKNLLADLEVKLTTHLYCVLLGKDGIRSQVRLLVIKQPS